MGISLRIFLPFILFYCFEVSSAQTVRNVVTYTTKPVEELECHFTSSSRFVVWSEQQDDGGTIRLFSYVSAEEIVQKDTNDTKHNNIEFHIDRDTNGFNLLIKNVDKDDGGRYVCDPFSADIVTYVVSVEVLPASISLNCTNLNGCSSSAEMEVSSQIVCICMATGISSEMVEIEWKGVSSLSTRNTKRDIDSTGSFSISSETTLPPPKEGFSLSCSLTGYESQIPESLRSSIYTFTPPVCNLLTKECLPDGKSASLICNCSDGSPEINAYMFYNSDKAAIDTQVSSEKEDANRIETFYCSGCNGVMHNPKFVEPEVKCQQGWNWWILIIVILILLVAAILFIFIRKKCKGKVRSPPSRDKGYVNVPMPKPEDPNKGLQLSSNVQKQENKEANKKKHEKNGSAGGPENNGEEVAVQTEEAPCLIEYTGTDTDTGESKFELTGTQAGNHGTSNDIATEEPCLIEYTGTDTDTGESKFDLTGTQAGNHGTSNDIATEEENKAANKLGDNQETGNVSAAIQKQQIWCQARM